MKEGVISGRLITGLLPVSLGRRERGRETDGEASQA